MMVTAAQVALILITATAAALAKIGPDTVISCSKSRSQGRMYPDPDDCRKFIRCVSRKPVLFTCPPNTAFDPDTQVCAWRVGKNGCGGKLAPTSWVGMIDNLINDISQQEEYKDGGIREKASTGSIWERSKKKFDQENASKQSQKYMKLEKSSRDLVEEPEVAVSTKTSSAPNTQPVRSLSSNSVQRKMEQAAPQKTKMASSIIGDRASSGKSKYRSFEGQTTMKTLSRNLDIMAKVKVEGRAALANKTENNTTEMSNSSQALVGSQMNGTKHFGDYVASTVRSSTRTKVAQGKEIRPSRKSVQSMSAPAVRKFESDIGVVKSEAYMSNLIKRENETVKDIASTNITFKMARETETRLNQSDLNTTIKQSEVAESQNANVTASRRSVTESNESFIAINASNPSTAPNTSALEALVNATIPSVMEIQANQTEDNTPRLKASARSSTVETLSQLLAQKNSKQNSFRNAMAKPTQITMYVPKSVQSKKYASSPRVDFYPVPQPYKAEVEPRSSKYSKLQDDLVGKTDATEPQQVDNTNVTTANGDGGIPNGTIVATSSGIDASKLAALKDILKYMTGKIVDRETFHVNDLKPKPKRWYDNNKAEDKKLDYERDESLQVNKTGNSAENNMVEQNSADEDISFQKTEGKLEYAHESPVSKEQASITSMPHVVIPSSDSDLTNSTNSTTAAPEPISNEDFSLKFMSSPYMVKGLTRDFTCPMPDGHFVDPKDCTIYYHCAAGVAYRRDCMTGQVFLAEAASCVSANLAPPCIQAYANKVEMDKTIAESICEDPNGLYKDTVSCAHYFECTNGWPIRRKCMSGTVFDEARGRCTWSKFVPGCESALSEEPDKTEAGMREKFDCPRDGYFRDSKDCGIYYLCTGGEPARKTCDPGTSFDASLNMCVWTYLVEGCEDRSGNQVVPEDKGDSSPQQRQTSEEQKITDFSCPEENGVFPDQEDCGTYYTCIDDVAKRLQCPYGTGFDDITSLCIDSRQVPRCLNPQRTEESRSSNLVQQPFTCPKHHGLYSDPYNCTRFIHCFNNTAYRHDCMPGTAFSSEKGLCTWRHLVPECNTESAPKTTPTPTATTAGKTAVPTVTSKMEISVPPFTPTPYRTKTVVPTFAVEVMRRSETKAARNALAQSDPETIVQSEPFQANHHDSSVPSSIEDFQCPSVLDGFYRDNLFCDIFHRCVLGTRFTFTCPTGTFFRSEGNLCDFWETVSDCTQDGIRLEAINSLPEVAPEPSPVPVPQRPHPVSNDVEVDVVNLDTEATPCPASNGLFAHPRNCKQFLFCAHHVPLVLTCPETLLYNAQTLTCDFAKNVQCVRYDHYSK